jgi:hypothetical protein
LEDKEKKSASMQSLYDNLRQEQERCDEAMKAAQKRFEAISMGNFMTEVSRDALFGLNLRSIRHNRALFRSLSQMIISILRKF